MNDIRSSRHHLEDVRPLGVDDLRIGTVVINTNDIGRATAFWSAGLGYCLRADYQAADPADTFRTLVPVSGHGVHLSLQLTDAPSAEPARIHLDLYTADQAGQVKRLVGLGAIPARDWPYPENPDFVVLRDPDGNEFCVIDHA
jgi:catechol 2,3-dioxygenase-like lactoylglutathione lyase family enzyme